MFDDRTAPNRENKRKSLFYRFKVFSKDNQLVGNLGDITLNGLKVISENPFQLNTMHTLKIKLPARISKDEQITFNAECVWCRKIEEENIYHLGFKTQYNGDENIKTIKIIMDLLASPDDLIL